MSALLYIVKVALEWLPNVELVTFLTILFTLVFGAETFAAVTIFNLFELIQWGFGTWWVSYLYVWPLLVTIVLLLRKAVGEEFLIWSVVSGGFGLIFGALFSAFYLFVDRSYAVTYFVAGLPWDVMHCIANFAVMLVLGKPLYRALKKLNQLYETGRTAL